MNEKNPVRAERSDSKKENKEEATEGEEEMTEERAQGSETVSVISLFPSAINFLFVLFSSHSTPRGTLVYVSCVAISSLAAIIEAVSPSRKRTDASFASGCRSHKVVFPFLTMNVQGDGRHCLDFSLARVFNPNTATFHLLPSKVTIIYQRKSSHIFEPVIAGSPSMPLL